MSPVLAFLRLSRPHFLVGGFVLYALGARFAPETSIATYLLGQTLVTSAQITAHYVNEYADAEVDQMVANRTLFSGGSGVIPAGDLPASVALRAGLVASAIAIGSAIAVTLVSPAAAILGLGALLVSWLYSAPPARLLDTGWGELATSAVVTVVVPAIGVLANGGTVDSRLVAVAAILFAIHMAMMLAFEFPDAKTDAAAGKRVLVVRLGTAAGIRLMGGLYLAAAAGLVAFGGVVRRPAFMVSTALIAAGLGSITVGATRKASHALATAAAVAALIVAAVALGLAAAPTPER